MTSRSFFLAAAAVTSPIWSATAKPPITSASPVTEPQPSIVYRSDETDATAQGLASQPQFSGTGVVYNGNNSELGTGAAIAANWVLTAKHVVTGYTTATFAAANGQSISGTVYTDSATDMALIKLDSPLITVSGQSYTPVALITPNLPGTPKVQPVGPLIWNVGYGDYGNFGGTVNNLDLRRRGGTNVVNSYGSSYLYFSNENTSGTEFECTTGSGDSGGPMFLQTGYQWRIAAEVLGVANGSFADTDVSFNSFLSTTTGISFAPQAAPASLTWNSAYLSPSTVASKNITNFTDGAGNWNTTRLDFVGATSGGDAYTYAWQNTTLLPVTFGVGKGAAGIVTVTTPISVSNVTFAVPGSSQYIIAGTGANVLTLAATGSAFTINSGVAPTISATLAGTGALTKLGAGNLLLSGSNTYSGGTKISAGTIGVKSTGALGTSGDITMAGGTLDLTALGTGGFTLASGRTLTNTGGAVSGVLNVSGTVTGAGSFSGNLTINSGGLLSATSGTTTVSGTITNNGTVRVTGGAILNAGAATSFVNNGVLDLITGNASLPSNFTNGSGGTVLTASSVVVKSVAKTTTQITLTVDGYSGHAYQLQRAASLDGTGFSNLGNSQNGSTGTALTFTDSSPATDQGFYRVVVSP